MSERQQIEREIESTAFTSSSVTIEFVINLDSPSFSMMCVIVKRVRFFTPRFIRVESTFLTRHGRRCKSVIRKRIEQGVHRSDGEPKTQSVGSAAAFHASVFKTPNNAPEISLSFQTVLCFYRIIACTVHCAMCLTIAIVSKCNIPTYDPHRQMRRNVRHHNASAYLYSARKPAGATGLISVQASRYR